MVRAEGEGGFDPTQIATAIEDAGFGAGEIRIEARGELVEHEDHLELHFPGPPDLLVLSGGEGFERFEASGPSVGSRIRVTGHLHPSRADQPPGMEVDRWEELEPASDSSSGC